MPARSDPTRAPAAGLPSLPAWVATGTAQATGSTAFLAGAALAVLDALVTDPAHGVPLRLLGARLALRSAVATSRLEGRMATEEAIRDAWHLAPPGAPRGPDGDLLAFWRAAAATSAHGPRWRAGVADLAGPELADGVDGWIRAGLARARGHGPPAGCAAAMAAVLAEDARAERVACLVADVTLARALGWRAPLPVAATGLTRAALRDLAAGCPGADEAAAAALLSPVTATVTLARRLAARAAALEAAIPRLRARGAAAAVGLLLREDAVAPSADLSPTVRGTDTPMSPRAARRLCGRLEGLGLVRELTGRATFRLYGLAP